MAPLAQEQVLLFSFNCLFWTLFCDTILFQMRSGYDGLGGRTKFIQPVSFYPIILLLKDIFQYTSASD